LAFAAEVKIPLQQELVTLLSPADFLSNVEAVGAFERGIAALVGAAEEEKKRRGRKVLVTGAKQKAAVRIRRLLLPSTGIIIDYIIFVEVNDVQPASIEFTVATIANSMANPSFASTLAAAMSLVPSIPAIVAVPPEPPKMERVTFEILRTPWPTHAPTKKAEPENASSNGFLDSTGSKIGLGAGLAFVIIASWYAYHRKKIGANATSKEVSNISKEEIDVEAAEAVAKDDKVVTTFALNQVREELGSDASVDDAKVLAADTATKTPVFPAPEMEISSDSAESDDKVEEDERIYNELDSEQKIAVRANSVVGTSRGEVHTTLQTDTSAPASHLRHMAARQTDVAGERLQSAPYSRLGSHRVSPELSADTDADVSVWRDADIGGASDSTLTFAPDDNAQSRSMVASVAPRDDTELDSV